MGYLRQVEKSAALVTMLFIASRETANKINHAKTPSADEFLDSLFFDQNGNIFAKLANVNGNIHNIILVRHHKHARNKTYTEVLQGIKDSLADIRQRTCQCSEQSFYYAWSALDLGIKDLALEERLENNGIAVPIILHR